MDPTVGAGAQRERGGPHRGATQRWAAVVAVTCLVVALLAPASAVGGETTTTSSRSGASAPSAPKLVVPPKRERVPGLKWRVKATARAAPGRDIVRWAWSVDRRRCAFTDRRKRSTGFWCAADTTGSVRLAVKAVDNRGDSSRTVRDVALAARQRRARLALSVSPAAVDPGATVVVRATLRDRRTGKAVIGMPLTLSAKPAPSTSWSPLVRQRTSKAGRASVSRTVTTRTRFLAATSAVRGVWRPANRKALASIPTKTHAKVNKTSVSLPGTVRVTGDTNRVHDGIVVTLQERLALPTGSYWRTAGYGYVEGDGAFHVDFQPDAAGTRVYRVRRGVGLYDASVSGELTVTATGGPRIVKDSAPGAVARGASFSVSGHFSSGGNGRWVMLQAYRPARAAWATIGSTAVTSKEGRFTVSDTMTLRRGTYSLRLYSDDHGLAPAESDAFALTVTG